MCGINGVWMYSERVVDKRILSMYEESLKYIDSRGGHATGIYFDGKIVKMPLRADDFIRVIHTLDRKYAIGSKEILGHTRYATVGSYNDNYNNHPFETERFVFAHNGSYYQFYQPTTKTVIDEYSKMIPKTDSFAIISTIQALVNDGYDIPKAIEETLNAGYGSYAFWIYDKKDDKLYLFREDNPLHLSQSKGFLMFASQRTQLPKRLQHKAISLKPTVLYEINRKGIITKHKLDLIDVPRYYCKSCSPKDYDYSWLDYEDYDSYNMTKSAKEFTKKKYGTVKITKKGKAMFKDEKKVLEALRELSQTSKRVLIYDENDEMITLLIYSDKIADEITEFLDEFGMFYIITYKSPDYVELEIYKTK